MDLLLVRHALPLRVEVQEGPADPPLSEHGHRQAEAMADWLIEEPLDALYVSPMRRALETAGPLAARLGVEAVVEDGLAEIDRHSSWYVPLEELKEEADPRYLEILAGEWDDIDPEQFKEETVGAVERIIADHPGRTVAAVCHGGVINAYAGHVLGIDAPLFFEPAYTSITRVRAAGSGERSVVSLNETAHLRGVGVTPP